MWRLKFCHLIVSRKYVQVGSYFRFHLQRIRSSYPIRNTIFRSKNYGIFFEVFRTKYLHTYLIEFVQRFERDEVPDGQIDTVVSMYCFVGLSF